jgi:hypothetical protein
VQKTIFDFDDFDKENSKNKYKIHVQKREVVFTKTRLCALAV